MTKEFTQYVSGTEILIHDKRFRDDKTVALRVSKFFEQGKAVHIELSEEETSAMYGQLKKIYGD